ncbi:MAG: FAD-dependent oxidoreductase [Aeromicrobium sp.]
MTHVITQNCCNDAACVPVCPVNCIHPTPDEPDYGTAEMLYIDPSGCIDCGACLDVCPVSAIAPDYELPDEFLQYEQINALYFKDPAHAEYDQNPERPAARRLDNSRGALRVAIVGSGPAACYAAEELLSQRALGAQVDMFERLPTPGGLVRFGVAPDHQGTKQAADTFGKTLRRKNFRLFLNTEVGRDITHEQLTDRYHAVIYAVGAMADRALDLPGEDLPGSHSATEFVAWYNGHPDFAGRTFDLSGERAVILGNGNVALDVARILVSDVERLRETDIADHALEQLAKSNIKEVVVVGRRGSMQAAFTTPELLGLRDLPGIDLLARPDELATDEIDEGNESFSMGRVKTRLLAELATKPPTHQKRITFRFLASPTEILGDGWTEGVRLVRNKLVDHDGTITAMPTGDTEDLSCGLVLRSVGYRGRPVAGLPFDDKRAVLPNVSGRLVEPETLDPIRGVYATGWIKRGPSGVIGTNKKCAKETVQLLIDDYQAGMLNEPAGAEDAAELLPSHLGVQGWKAIDAYEKAAGKEVSRPRVKLVNVDEMLDIARASS